MLGIVAIVVLGGTAAGVIAVRAQHGPAAPTPSPTFPVSPTVRPTSGSPAPPPTERQAAQSLSTLLSRSVADRGSIDAAANDVSNCGSQLAKDAQTFRNAAKSRQNLLTSLAGLPGRSTLPAPMLGALTKAWKASAQADQDLAGWATDESGGCVPNDTSDAHYQAATGPDNRATRLKKAFAGQWDAIAARYSLPSYQWNQL